MEARGLIQRRYSTATAVTSIKGVFAVRRVVASQAVALFYRGAFFSTSARPLHLSPCALTATSHTHSVPGRLMAKQMQYSY